MRRASVRRRAAIAAAAAVTVAAAATGATAEGQAPVPASPSAARVLDGPGFAGYGVDDGADLNGDGIPDLVVGAPLASPRGVPDAGSVFIVFGPGADEADLTSLGRRGMRIDGFEAGGNLGRRVAHGDINGDGVDDLIVTAPALGTEGNHPTPRGGTYVVFGGPGLPAHLEARALGRHGFAIDLDATDVASGDVNGDGIDDVVVGAANVLDRDGLAVVVFGRRGPSGDVRLVRDILHGAGRTSFYKPAGSRGYWVGPDLRGGAALGLVTAAGDVSGDGIDDVILGAPESSHHRRREGGSVFVVYGRRAPESTIVPAVGARQGLRVLGARAGDHAGRGVAAADLDGDGVDELVVGAPRAGSGARSRAGEVFIVDARPGRPTGLVDLASWWREGVARIASGVRAEEAGTALDTADLDGDGERDLLVGAPYAGRGSLPLAGRVYSVTRAPAAGETLDLAAPSDAVRELFLGDGLDAAGVAIDATDAAAGRPAQVIIGAPLAGSGSVATLGRAYVVAGDSGVPVAPPAGSHAGLALEGGYRLAERGTITTLHSAARNRHSFGLTEPHLEVTADGRLLGTGRCNYDQGCMAKVEVEVESPPVAGLTFTPAEQTKVYPGRPAALDPPRAAPRSKWSAAWDWLRGAGGKGRAATVSFNVTSLADWVAHPERKHKPFPIPKGRVRLVAASAG